MSKNILLVGSSSLFSSDENFVGVSGRGTFEKIVNDKVIPSEISNKLEVCRNVLISVGSLLPKTILEKTRGESCQSLEVNLLYPVILSELLLKKYDDIKIVIVSSESGFKGSYDTEYALAKSSINMYVKERGTKPGQAINAIAPSLVYDSPMTMARDDLSVLDPESHPKGRFLESSELIEVAKNIFNASDYFTNQVLSVDGGKFARWRSY